MFQASAAAVTLTSSSRERRSTAGIPVSMVCTVWVRDSQSIPSGEHFFDIFL